MRGPRGARVGIGRNPIQSEHAGIGDFDTCGNYCRGAHGIENEYDRSENKRRDIGVCYTLNGRIEIRPQPQSVDEGKILIRVRGHVLNGSMVGNHAYVPVRVFAELLGHKVNWRRGAVWVD